MIGLFSSVKPLVQPKPKIQVPRPDNQVFRLHYRFTFAILLIGSILVSSYSYIDSSGSAIQCMMDKGAPVPDKVINRYCWIMSTFTLPKHFKGTQGDDFLHFGVGAHVEADEKIYHAYYQWVPLMLFLQGLMFYAPHWIWKQIEGGRMKNIIVGLNEHITSEDNREEKVKQLADYMKQRMDHSAEHQMWAFNFFICEVLNFVNVVAQIFITNAFLGGEFTKYGTEVINFPYMDPEDRVDPMSRIFPKMTKCTFHKYGGSGTIQRFDALCVLGMNIINEKIYIFLWFWFVILAVITGINLIIRIVQLLSPNVRNRYMLLDSRGYLDGKVSRQDINDVVSNINYSDWLILYSLAQSMDKENFGALMRKISDDRHHHSRDDEESLNIRGDSPDGTLRSPAKFPKSVFSLKRRKSNS